MNTRLLFEGSTASPEDTEDLAGRLYREFLAGRSQVMLLLDGELGAGKTCFVRGLAEPLGINETVNSPTFNLLNEYHGRSGELWHYDLYRLGSERELEELDFPERWSGRLAPSGCAIVHAVEWWQRAGGYLKDMPAFRLELLLPETHSEERLVRFYSNA
ncbi:MAG: tRNA (adenosine(37)-N6)-threonylcarbamoyltransferase complex ATPase subunit type 1 TsaE [Spirochaetales bacterium]|nr:tRNA (adenosine(37)-N6)-threonylcarbamoyltransferase complex ATPase subunit type 1 TsaE [Spirochaetales bacterium]MCP5486538.1 tRNA (adenosine(37)-N6)-threonylcarbamoyltransferase complex ATPase subunit type 1 TsaE [Spirochaetales bacterium]